MRILRWTIDPPQPTTQANPPQPAPLPTTPATPVHAELPRSGSDEPHPTSAHRARLSETTIDAILDGVLLGLVVGLAFEVLYVLLILALALGVLP